LPRLRATRLRDRAMPAAEITLLQDEALNRGSEFRADI
jgi:hypothetical protein